MGRNDFGESVEKAIELVEMLCAIPKFSNHEGGRADLCRKRFIIASSEDVYVDDALSAAYRLNYNDEKPPSCLHGAYQHGLP